MNFKSLRTTTPPFLVVAEGLYFILYTLCLSLWRNGLDDQLMTSRKDHRAFVQKCRPSQSGPGYPEKRLALASFVGVPLSVPGKCSNIPPAFHCSEGGACNLKSAALPQEPGISIHSHPWVETSTYMHMLRENPLES